MEYNHAEIEKKWQDRWERDRVFAAHNDSLKPKYYCLIEFPFPSGDGLHVGHIRSNTAMDIIARKRRAEGFDVLYPIGWDSFGLPTENYAIKTGIHPRIVTKTNTDNFRRQLKALGFSFDWDREVDTSDPSYYRWTQWIFLQLLKHDLAYKQKRNINWCPKDKIGLANEEVVDGMCERCGTPTEMREKEQWMLAITKYADRLDRDLDTVNFLPKIKVQQRNWIGRSEGALVSFKLKGVESKIEVFTTRPDTIFGATYLVLAPEHPLIGELKDAVSNWSEVSAYVDASQSMLELERTREGRQKSGVCLGGVIATNPASGEEIPVFVADYVLGHYGTGAVMAVPAHDERDWEFAKKFNLPTREVIEPLVRRVHGEDAYRPDAPVSERRAVVGILKHWSEEKYLGVHWKKTGWKGFVIGGIEGDEDAQIAGLREIAEETGYASVTPLKKIGGVVHAQFYQLVKKENRFAHFEPMLFGLFDERKTQTSPEEQELHDFVWLTPDEMDAWITHPDMRIIWDRLQGPTCYAGEGILANSGMFSGRYSSEIKKEITESVGGVWVTKYKLRDWIFSRQRYWGEPIPVVHCDRCGIVPVSEADLPVELPEVENYQPTDTGESPLAAIDSWVNTDCPSCKGPAKRETDTMPNWAGSSWYFLRYADPRNTKVLAEAPALLRWMPVDWYNGGLEHTTLHLLYSRFWHKFLFDIGVVSQSEPYVKRTSHGIVLAADGEKMSKSKGNTISPDETVARLGADTLRMYEMFMGPFDQAVAWSMDGVVGCRRFLERVWKLADRVKFDVEIPPALDTLFNKTIQKVSVDIELFKLNTAVSALMIFANEMERHGEVSPRLFGGFLRLLNPIAPHITEELWERLGNATLLANEPWPKVDATKLEEETSIIAVQVNGKVRGSVTVGREMPQEAIVALARSDETIEKWITGKEVSKIVYIPGRLLSLVVK